MSKSEKPSKPTLVSLEKRKAAPLITPTDLKAAATTDISAAMNGILADVFTLYLKTKNFHWHMSGPHFRDYHVMLDEQADQIYAMADPIAGVSANLVAPRCVPLDTLPAPSGFWTTTLCSWSHPTCWSNCVRQ